VRGEGDVRGRTSESSGFTIIELMVVVIIVSVLATIAVPGFTGGQQTDRVSRAAKLITTTFETARSRAIQKNVAVRIILHRSTSDSTLNVRVDESPDSSCTGWVRIATRTVAPDPNEANAANPCSSWVAGEQYRCGIATAAITGTSAWGGYIEAGVTLTSVAEGTTGAWTPRDDLVICMNRRGRMLRWTGVGWTPITGGLRLELDRADGSGTLGVKKVVLLPQGGIAGEQR
jgi:prepilin-type N-terminal cleavage/methylation domain-containing protein